MMSAIHVAKYSRYGGVKSTCSECGEELESEFYHKEGTDTEVFYKCPNGHLKITSEEYHAYRDSERDCGRQEEWDKLAKSISQFVNGANDEDYKEVAKRMCNDHRTLQQSSMKFVMTFIEQMAINSVDGRNEAAVNLAKRIAVLEDKYLPLV